MLSETTLNASSYASETSIDRLHASVAPGLQAGLQYCRNILLNMQHSLNTTLYTTTAECIQLIQRTLGRPTVAGKGNSRDKRLCNQMYGNIIPASSSKFSDQTKLLNNQSSNLLANPIYVQRRKDNFIYLMVL
jgi:hypothetical protein